MDHDLQKVLCDPYFIPTPNMDVEATQLISLAFDCPRLPQIHSIPPNSVTSPVARVCFISLLSVMEVALFLCDAVVLFKKKNIVSMTN